MHEPMHDSKAENAQSAFTISALSASSPALSTEQRITRQAWWAGRNTKPIAAVMIGDSDDSAASIEFVKSRLVALTDSDDM